MNKSFAETIKEVVEKLRSTAILMGTTVRLGNVWWSFAELVELPYAGEDTPLLRDNQCRHNQRPSLVWTAKTQALRQGGLQRQSMRTQSMQRQSKRIDRVRRRPHARGQGLG